MRVWPALVVLIGLLPWSAAATGVPAAIEHRIHARLEPENGLIAVTDRVRLAHGGPVRFEMAPGLVPGQATLDDEPIATRAAGNRYRSEARAKPGQELEIVYRFDVAEAPDPERAFLNRRGGWLPAWTDWLPRLGDGPVRFDLTLEAPVPLVAVASGDLVHEERTGRVYRARFVSPRPGEPPSAFAGDYEVGETVRTGVRVRMYFPRERVGLAPLYQERALQFLRWFEERIGPYPYAGFAIVAAPIPVGLGFAGLTYVSEGILPLPFMRTRSLAHEILHNWWGNAVEVRHAEGNWAEGLTTYMADHGLAGQEGEGAARAMRLAWLRDYNALPASEDGPLTSFVQRSHDGSQVVGYNKAAFLFHMLERRLGREGFETALQDFYGRHLGAAAAWFDLRASFERVAATDLETFFRQWLIRIGAPELRLVDAERTSAERGWRVAVTLAQQSPTYHLQVPVEVRTVAGIERALVDLNDRRARATIRVAAEPLAVAVDPDLHLFRRLAAGEAPPIMRDVTLDPRTGVVLTEGAGEAGAALAGALLGRSPDVVAPDGGLPEGRPLIVIGVGDASILPKRPDRLAGRGSARAWTARRRGAPPLFVVHADDAPALAALVRPLPHYRRSSFVIFGGDQMLREGVWPQGPSALGHSFR